MKPDRLRVLLERAPQRGFAGLVLDGIDIEAAIAAETDADLLNQAAAIAQRNSEPTWAERLARRASDIDDKPQARLRLASILAGAGRCEEANMFLAGVVAETDENLYLQVCGVLHAKAGRVDEAIALFEALPDRLDGYYPSPITFRTAQEMLEQCELAHATAFVARLAEAYPAHLVIRGLNLRCQLFAGHADAATALAQVPANTIECAPRYDRRFFIEAVTDALELPGRTNEAFDFLADQIRRDPTHWSLYDRAANNARLAARDADYAVLVAAIPTESRDAPEAHAVLFQWHADNSRFEQSREILDALRVLSARLFLQAKLYFALYAHAGNLVRFEEAFDTCAKCGIDLTGQVVAYGLHQYYYNCSPTTMQNCLAKLDQSAGSARTNVYYWQIYLRCLIAIGDQRRASECYKALPAGLANGALLRPFGIYFDAMDGRHLKARAEWTDYIRSTRHLCVNAPSSYPRTIALKYAEAPGAVLLFVTLYNGMDYIDWFLKHYRALGVDHFFVVDNGSNDGSKERLLEERDVSLFSNSESFARSGFGVFWINHLMQRFGVGHWCFHVDIDEAFVFPDHDKTRTLRDLLSYCDEHSFGLVPGIEIDMYHDSLEGHADGDPFAACCYFDADYVTTQSELPPYVMIQGGIRRRLTGLALSMHKTPLVRMAPDVRFIECNHSTTHLPVADVSAGLLHFKFVGDVKQRVELAVFRGEHFGTAISYRRLENALTSLSYGESLLTSHSRRYAGPESLVQSGLIGSGDAWVAYRPKRPE